MSDTTTPTSAEWWVGPPEAIEHERVARGLAASSDFNVITEAFLSEEMVASVRWVGIEPPPAGARVLTLHAPDEASGSLAWRKYQHGSYAPECDLVAARWFAHKSESA